MKATEQYFPVVLFIMLYKVVLTFESFVLFVSLIKNYNFFPKVLAYRGKFWTMLQNACRTLWNMTQTVLMRVLAGTLHLSDESRAEGGTDIDVLRNILWRQFYFGADRLLDMMVQIQEQIKTETEQNKKVREHVRIFLGYRRSHSSIPIISSDIFGYSSDIVEHLRIFLRYCRTSFDIPRILSEISSGNDWKRSYDLWTVFGDFHNLGIIFANLRKTLISRLFAKLGGFSIIFGIIGESSENFVKLRYLT